MSRHVGNAGAFYTYITQGLGKPLGIGGAMMALATYATVQLAIYGLFSVFMRAAMLPLGIDLPWSVWAFGVLAVVTFFGQYNIGISGRILGVCMVAEVAILLLLNIGILRSGGAEGLSWSGLRPSEVFGQGFGVTLVFVIGSFIGFEATAIFGEEATNPARTIPRATYLAVLLITVFYAFSSWAIVQFYGPSKVVAAANASLDNFYFNAAQRVLGGWSVELLNVLLITSLFACLLSFHNTLNRYAFALGREGVAWAPLARVHSRHGSPYFAGRFQAVLGALALLAFAAFKADPYQFIFPWMSALAVIGVLAVQVLVCIAIIVFFRKQQTPHSLLVTTIAPAVAGLCLVGFFLLVSFKLELLTGSKNRIVATFPILMLGVGCAGVLFALRLRRVAPHTYERLGRAFE
jgi:amino acid transporter